MPRPVELIRFRFPDGVYSFWCAQQPGRTARIVFRVKETGEGAWLTPQKRLENLTREFIAARDPESAETYERFTERFPADLTTVVRWFAGHTMDLEDFLAQHLSTGRMTSTQRAAFAKERRQLAPKARKTRKAT